MLGGDTLTYTEAQKKATKKYLNTLKSLSIRISEEDYIRYKNSADLAGMSLRSFVIQSLEEKIDRISKENE